MSEVCTDNRFEIIAAYKKMLVERTNIETSPDEMAVIDNVLFRFWQLGWLPPVPHGDLVDKQLMAETNEQHYKIVEGVPEADYARKVVLRMLDQAPTIIQASEEAE